MRPNILKPLCSIELVNGALAVTSPYSPEFVEALKLTIPASDRKWDGASKRWFISPAYGSQIQRLIEQFYGESVNLPQATGGAPQSEMRLLDVRYLGAAKERTDGTQTASAWVNGGWGATFPKSVLMEWFGQSSKPDEATTLYGVLGVSQNVEHEDLRKAWKRLILQWHPDRAKELDAPEQFRAIQEAYEVLGDPVKRAKYNVGLHFEKLTKVSGKRIEYKSINHEWRAPLRCGLILVEGQEHLGGFFVSKILEWKDITDSQGRVLCTSWTAGEDKFTEVWLAP